VLISITDDHLAQCNELSVFTPEGET
jgi:hypothetical protein